MKNKLGTAFLLIIIISTCMLSIGYAAINNITETIEGTIAATPKEGIFIADVTYLPKESRNVNKQVINNYTDTILNSSVELNRRKNAQAVYKVDVCNTTDETVYYLGPLVEEGSEFYSNEAIEHIEKKIIVHETELPPHSCISFDLIFKFKSNQLPLGKGPVKLDSIIKYKFGKRFDITYENINNPNLPKYAYEKEPIDIQFADGDNTSDISVYENNKLKAKDKYYTFENNLLHINNPQGNIKVVVDKSDLPPSDPNAQINFKYMVGSFPPPAGVPYYYEFRLVNNDPTRIVTSYQVFIKVPDDFKLEEGEGASYQNSHHYDATTHILEISGGKIAQNWETVWPESQIKEDQIDTISHGGARFTTKTAPTHPGDDVFHAVPPYPEFSIVYKYDERDSIKPPYAK